MLGLYATKLSKSHYASSALAKSTASKFEGTRREKLVALTDVPLFSGLAAPVELRYH